MTEAISSWASKLKTDRWLYGVITELVETQKIHYGNGENHIRIEKTIITILESSH